MNKKLFLGIELGSTRIKAVCVDEKYKVQDSGDYVWESNYENGIWTYDIKEAISGVTEAISQLKNLQNVSAVGISGMMHGYLAFDKDWNLLVPFRTWQNRMTGDAVEILERELNYKIPQRWSIAHLYQAILNKEEHIGKIAHITTLAGYIHYLLTGENCLGICEASGMFPIDEKTNDYNAGMLEKFDALTENFEWKIKDILPKVLVCGESGGCVTKEGSAHFGGVIPEGIIAAPPEGDAATGMVATNAVAPGTGNISAGTSIFSMVVLEKQLSKIYREIDVVTTPDGMPVGMVHCANGTKDNNEWVSVLKETAELFSEDVNMGDLYTKLYKKSLEGESDCGGILVCNYISGEGVTDLTSGRPLVVRKPGSKFTLANFMRAQIYSAMATLMLGMEIFKKENVRIDSISGHGGLFKTPGVGQRYMAAACGAPVICMETAGEGGAYGMAILAGYAHRGKTGDFPEFLNTFVFADMPKTTLSPDSEDEKGFRKYMEEYKKLIVVERSAVENLI